MYLGRSAAPTCRDTAKIPIAQSARAAQLRPAGEGAPREARPEAGKTCVLASSLLEIRSNFDGRGEQQFDHQMRVKHEINLKKATK